MKRRYLEQKLSDPSVKLAERRQIEALLGDDSLREKVRKKHKSKKGCLKATENPSWNRCT